MPPFSCDIPSKNNNIYYDSEDSLSEDESYDDMWNEIYRFEGEYGVKDAHYYIGLYQYIPKDNELLIASKIKPKTLFYYKIYAVLYYLQG